MASQWQQQQFNRPLPSGWEARYDPNKARYYFINHATRETTWNDPRTRVPQHRQPASIVEIPLQEFSSEPHSRAEASRGRAQQQETAIGNVSDDEDDVWKNELLKRAMKSMPNKHKIKEKLKREFEDLDPTEMDAAIELCNYDEKQSREMLQGLKASMAEEMKRRKVRRMEEERKEKEQAEKRKAERRRQENERKQRERLEELEELRNAERQRTPRSAFTANSTPTVASSMVSSRTKKASASSAVTKYSQQATQSTGRNKVYVSAYRVVPAGPQVSLRRGPNPDHLLPQWIQPAGPNKAFVAGPQKGIRKGAGGTDVRVSLSQGPQSSLYQGPQHNSLVTGSMFRTYKAPPVTAL